MPSAKEAALIDHLHQLLEPVVLDHGLELVELQFRREAAGWVLRLIIDAAAPAAAPSAAPSDDDGPPDGAESTPGVGIDDCARVSREVSHLLEVEDPIEQPFSLEVSSPGLDRPLKRERDYIRCRGKLAKLVCREKIGGDNVVIGRLGELNDGSVTVATDAGPVKVPLAAVRRAKLIIEW